MGWGGVGWGDNVKRVHLQVVSKQSRKVNRKLLEFAYSWPRHVGGTVSPAQALEVLGNLCG